MIRQPAPNHIIRQPAPSYIPEAIHPNQTTSMSTEFLIRRAVGLRPTKTALSQPASTESYDSPASTELYPRGDSPEPDDFNEYRILDLSRCGSPTNEDDIVTAGEAPIRGTGGRRYREESCVCTGVEGPNGVFTNTRSRFSSRAQEAACYGSEMKKARDTRMRSRSSSLAPEVRNGSDSSKAKSKKAKDTEKSSKPSSASDNGEPRGKGLGPVPIFLNYSFCIDEFAGLTSPNRHKMVVASQLATKAEMEKQERNQCSVCVACQRKTDRPRTALWRKRCKQQNGDRVTI